uniref:Uncharacterized protein n=1 Tax=Candidatus Kentrum sp. SD TaxID=2126332 RepID=A0A450Z883_9GAMM|nr:MAG: hypothetical protein BECKSD772F_GA0070984_13222 [Candidatus Kentron sp. SD]VFK49994.1 MAG: hypothetical protein BECKSD772E_GA0070983_13151 [Candidatus Kentron sp. SD]
MQELKLDLPKITKKELLEAISKGVERAFPEQLKNTNKSYEVNVFEAIADGVKDSFPEYDDILWAIQRGVKEDIYD